jgi:glutamate formiminotransferase
MDVVPFVPLSPSTLHDAVQARQTFAEWAAGELGIPCFLYGPTHGALTTDRTLPDIRRRAWRDLLPDLGPQHPHPTAGAICVGARPILIAYNIWMHDPSGGANVRSIAQTLRSASVRTLALAIGDHFQVSMNLVDPESAGPFDVYTRVQELSQGTATTIERCELVGLIPESVLERSPRHMWEALDLGPDKTIEHRLRARGIQLS